MSAEPNKDAEGAMKKLVALIEEKSKAEFSQRAADLGQFALGMAHGIGMGMSYVAIGGNAETTGKNRALVIVLSGELSDAGLEAVGKFAMGTIQDELPGRPMTVLSARGADRFGVRQPDSTPGKEDE